MKEQNGGVVLREKNGIFYYTVPLFESAGGVTAAFSTRRGGVSCGKLDSLNLGFSKPEPRENVQENYRRFFGALDLDPEKMVLTVQQHTDIILPDAHTRTGMGWADFPDVVDACAGTGDGQQIGIEGIVVHLGGAHENALRRLDVVADAAYTDDPGCVLVKLTADCVPVLLYAPDVRAVAAVHDGWRSTAARLAQKTAQALVSRYGADPKKMLAAVGPSIGPCCFEVDEPVMKVFTEAFDENVAKKTGVEKWHVDLWECNVRQLLDAGLSMEHIAVAGVCTRCSDETLHYSYRRDGAGCGSLAAVIALRPQKDEK